MKKQTGHVYRSGQHWVVRYRENLVENGKLVRRHMARKVDVVLPEHQRLKRAPAVVLEKAQAMLAPLNSGKYDPQATQTLVEYVEQKYFPDHENLIRKSTLAGYKRRWKFLKPYCGSIRLRDFRTVDGQRILNEIARQNPALLGSTLQHLKSLLSAFFTYAIGLGILDGEVTISGTRKTVTGNPMRGVRIPNAPEGEETYAYSLEEITQIMMRLPQPAYTIVACAAFTGLRRSELAGLQWQDYTGTEISVTRSVWEGRVDKPKTRKSKAPVPCIPVLTKILDAYRERSGNPASGVMFASQKGTPLNLNNVLNRMILPELNVCIHCRKAEVDHRREDEHKYERNPERPQWHGWHSFRRGLGTTLHRLRVDDLTIQRILRHSNVAVTQACYIKSLPAESVAAMNLLEEALCVNCAQIPQPVIN